MKLWVKILFIILIVCITIFTTYNALIRDVPVALGFLSVELAITSIIFAIHSIEIGNKSTEIATESRDISDESKEIASDSKERMEALANTTFLQVMDSIENARLAFRNQRNRRMAVWKSFTYLRQIDELRQYAKDDYHKIVGNYFRFHMLAYPWTNEHIVCEEVKHFLRMYKYVLRLNLSEERKNQIVELLEHEDRLNVSKINTETNEEYIERMLRSVKRFDDEVIYHDIKDRLEGQID